VSGAFPGGAGKDEAGGWGTMRKKSNMPQRPLNSVKAKMQIKYSGYSDSPFRTYFQPPLLPHRGLYPCYRLPLGLLSLEN
jgi:hypothetical protein